MITRVFKNLTAEDIRDSVAIFEEAINQAQIIMFPGGFSAGDEPDGSAKFFATAFQNAKIKEAVTKLLNEREGLALGICNGFQALIKLGLVPYGEIVGQTADSPTPVSYTHLQRQMGAAYQAEVPLNCRFCYEDLDLLVEGRADGIEEKEDHVMIDEIKGVHRELRFVEEPVPVHLAQARCYAAIYAEQNLSRIHIYRT